MNLAEFFITNQQKLLSAWRLIGSTVSPSSEQVAQPSFIEVFLQILG